MTAGKQIDGGLGHDTLIWQHTSNDGGYGSGDHPSNIVNWEEIELRNGSQLSFIYTTGNLTLGDAETGTGTISLDVSSMINAGESYGYGILPHDRSQLVTVNNAGVINLTNDQPSSGNSLHDTFTIRGNYMGQNGKLWLHSYLGGDDSPSDKLIIDGGGAAAPQT